MGREIRRVPPGWQHPRRPCPHFRCDEAARNNGTCFHPLHDNDFETVAREWLDNAVAWDKGTHPDAAENKADCPFYWQYHGDPPNPEYYRPKWTDEERTHFQVYETVSEGTPVTPVFATKEELVEHLVAHGDSWGAARGDGGWSREEAEKFAGSEWAPSLVAREVKERE